MAVVFTFCCKPYMMRCTYIHILFDTFFSVGLEFIHKNTLISIVAFAVLVTMIDKMSRQVKVVHKFLTTYLQSAYFCLVQYRYVVQLLIFLSKVLDTCKGPLLCQISFVGK